MERDRESHQKLLEEDYFSEVTFKGGIGKISPSSAPNQPPPPPHPSPAINIYRPLRGLQFFITTDFCELACVAGVPNGQKINSSFQILR